MARLEGATGYLTQLRRIRSEQSGAVGGVIQGHAYHMNAKTAAKILAVSDAKGMLQRIDGFPVVLDEDLEDDKVYFVRPMSRSEEAPGGVPCPK